MGDEYMDRNYIAYKCIECGTVFIIPSECIKHSNNYVTCPMYGKHKHIIVIGAYDSVNECMDHDKFKRIAGAIRRD
jgi:predicted RNA-binding Zn-ribbon protein involved in translation (DUF1610 family)